MIFNCQFRTGLVFGLEHIETFLMYEEDEEGNELADGEEEMVEVPAIMLHLGFFTVTAILD